MDLNIAARIKKGKIQSKLEQLIKLPRYSSGNIKLGKYNFFYTDPLAFYFEYKDIFQNRIYHFKTDNLKPRIIDAGGYIGISTIYFKDVYPNSSITVFEPDPDIYLILKKNIEMNHLKGIKTVNAALGKKSGVTEFYRDKSDGGSLKNIREEAIKVKIERLSTYIKTKLDFLKMNIEGAEGDVIYEIQNNLKNINEIIIEYHAFYNLSQALGRILTVFDKYGFRYFVTDGTNAKIPVPFNMPKKFKYFNLIYAKKIN